MKPEPGRGSGFLCAGFAGRSDRNRCPRFLRGQASILALPVTERPVRYPRVRLLWPIKTASSRRQPLVGLCQAAVPVPLPAPSSR